MIKPTYSMWIALRGRRGLEEDDKSQDAEIVKMDPVKAVKECVGWELGDPSWAERIAGWMVAAGADPKDF
jgi:hypothetical protein